MAQDHRGREVGDNHFNKVQWQRQGSDLYGTVSSPKSARTSDWDAEVSPNDGGEGYLMRINEPHWGCEDGGCQDTVGHGHYRTEKRAKTAVEALVKRSGEGRDMQTGRKGYKSGSGGGYEQPKSQDTY